MDDQRATQAAAGTYHSPMTTATTVQAASLAPTHPALRWTPLDAATPMQHRRAHGQATACGVVGHLTLAETSHPRCLDCFATDRPARVR